MGVRHAFSKSLRIRPKMILTRQLETPPLLRVKDKAVFSRGLATLDLAVSVGPSVTKTNYERFFAFPPLPTRPRLRGCVFGLVYYSWREGASFCPSVPS